MREGARERVWEIKSTWCPLACFCETLVSVWEFLHCTAGRYFPLRASVGGAKRRSEVRVRLAFSKQTNPFCSERANLTQVKGDTSNWQTSLPQTIQISTRQAPDTNNNNHVFTIFSRQPFSSDITLKIGTEKTMDHKNLDGYGTTRNKKGKA